MNFLNTVVKVTEKSLKFVGFKSLGNLFEYITLNGGVKQAAVKLIRFDDLKKGDFVGEDEFGNKYFQNDYYFFGRNRWVQYADYTGLNYDASQVSPQWYGWLHYKTDFIPTEDPNRPAYPWMLSPTENFTGGEHAYVAYSTGKPKITLWKPKSNNRK